MDRPMPPAPSSIGVSISGCVGAVHGNIIGGDINYGPDADEVVAKIFAEFDARAARQNGPAAKRIKKKPDMAVGHAKAQPTGAVAVSDRPKPSRRTPKDQASEFRSLYKKGASHASAGRWDHAIAIYDEIISRFGITGDPNAQELLAEMLLLKAEAMVGQARADEALLIYDKLIQELAVGSWRYVRAYMGKADALNKLERFKEQIATCEKAILQGDLGDVDCLYFMRMKAHAGRELNKRLGFVPRLLLRGYNEYSLVNELLAKFGTTTDANLANLVIMTLLEEAQLYGSTGYVSAQIRVYDSIVTFYDSLPDPAVARLVASAFVSKGLTFCELSAKGTSFNRYKNRREEVAVWRDIIDRYGQLEQLSESRAIALAVAFRRTADLHAEDGSYKKVMEACDAAIARLDGRTELAVREQVAYTFYDKWRLLRKLRRRKEAAAVYNEILIRFGMATDPNIKMVVEIVMKDHT